MHTLLSPLHPALPILLNHLGAHSALDSLLELPEVFSADAQALRQSRSTEPYHVQLQSQSLTLSLQCMNPEASPAEQTWGLQGISLNAPAWRGSQPEGALELHQMTAEDVLALFADQLDSDEVMNMHPMLCFPFPCKDEQEVNVLAVFEQDSRKLQTLSLLHLGAWRVLSPSMEVPVAAHEKRPMPVTGTPATALCVSGGTVPRSGIWEGQLPLGHPQAELFKDAPHRFVFKRQGDTMETLGLPAFDERLVRWVWLREW